MQAYFVDIINGMEWKFTTVSSSVSTSGSVGSGVNYEPAISKYTTGDISIPDKFALKGWPNGMAVRHIGDFAFTHCSMITSVEIPDGVVSIGDWAFYGCSSLVSVMIPFGVTTIGGWAF